MTYSARLAELIARLKLENLEVISYTESTVNNFDGAEIIHLDVKLLAPHDRKRLPQKDAHERLQEEKDITVYGRFTAEYF